MISRDALWESLGGDAVPVEEWEAHIDAVREAYLQNDYAELGRLISRYSFLYLDHVAEIKEDFETQRIRNENTNHQIQRAA